MRYRKKEHFVNLMINVKGEIIEETEVSVGDLCSSTTHPREVFVDAVRRSAGSVVFIHNHPSGDPTPSEADIATTIVEKIQTSQLNPVGRGAWVLGKLIRHAYVRDSEG